MIRSHENAPIQPLRRPSSASSQWAPRGQATTETGNVLTWKPPTSWQPTEVTLVARAVQSSTRVVLVETDAGAAYIKTPGNPEGPHVLATDYVGTHLAAELGLSTVESAIMQLSEFDCPLLPGHPSTPGPAFATRAIHGAPWSGKSEELANVANLDDVIRLIILDTWLRNCDRHDTASGGRAPNYDNVFLSTESPELRGPQLMAMDQGLCFIRSGQSLDKRLRQIEKIRDSQLYGLFPGFRHHIDMTAMDSCLERLRMVKRSMIRDIVESIPKGWDVPPEAREAMVEFTSQRAVFAGDNFRDWFDREEPWFGGEGLIR